MDELRTWIADAWDIEMVRAGLRAALVIIGGLLVLRIANARMRQWSLQAQHRLVFRRLVGAVIIMITGAWAMAELGLEIGVVLGAAGVLTVAVGFAAQTSFSNLISGIFLMAEQPFRVGDLIEIDTFSGEVLSIDLLSVKICTFDNLQVRVPNETMLKANVITLTRFAIRRYDYLLPVPYEQDLAQMREVLFAVAEDNPLTLRNPAPVFIFRGYNESGCQIQFSVWAKRENFVAMRTEVAIDIQRAFAVNDIHLATAQRTLHLSDSAAAHIDRWEAARTATRGTDAEELSSASSRSTPPDTDRGGGS